MSKQWISNLFYEKLKETIIHERRLGHEAKVLLRMIQESYHNELRKFFK